MTSYKQVCRDFFKLIGCGIAAIGLPLIGAAAALSQSCAPGGKPNVLLIAVDDLRPELGCYGNTEIQTPNIDQLASEGRVFARHYVQSAVCGPSRCSLLTGKRVRSWDCWKRFRRGGEEPKTPVSIAHLFHRGGYRTVCIGKISHQPGGVIDPDQKIHEVPFSWDLAYAPVGKWNNPWGAFFCYADGSVRPRHYDKDQINHPAYESADVPDEGYADGLNAREAIKQLRDLKRRERPFFLAVGFYKPHLPHNAPKMYWDLYDPAEIPAPENNRPPKNVDPRISLHQSVELTMRYAWPGGLGRVTAEQARNQRHAYYACVSYVDAQIGKVLDELKRLELDHNTIVVLWGDHGWHLGDHGIFGKHTNFEVATRSPLIIRTPNIPKSGQAASGLVETVDIYPTLADLCGLVTPKDLPGMSLKPLLTDPEHDGKDGAFSFFSRGRYFGRTLRTERYRIVEWTDEKTQKSVQIELYDHRNDPAETVNVANEPEHKDLVARLLSMLKSESRLLAENVP